MKSQVDQQDVDKLVPVPIDLRKLSDVVRKEAVKKEVYDKLIKAVNAIDTNAHVKKYIMMLRSTRLKVKYLVLLAWLLLLVLMMLKIRYLILLIYLNKQIMMQK